MATNNLTTEQIARVYATYIGQKLQSCRGIVTLNAVDLDDLPDSAEEFAKLILRPLSAITDEDARVIAMMEGMAMATIDRAPTNRIVMLDDTYRIELYFDGEMALLKGGNYKQHTSAFAAYQYLIQKSYAVPLFIAPNHPDNGKTAIELGIAISNEAFKNQQK